MQVWHTLWCFIPWNHPEMMKMCLWTHLSKSLPSLERVAPSLASFLPNVITWRNGSGVSDYICFISPHKSLSRYFYWRRVSNELHMHAIKPHILQCSKFLLSCQYARTAAVLLLDVRKLIELALTPSFLWKVHKTAPKEYDKTSATHISWAFSPHHSRTGGVISFW